MSGTNCVGEDLGSFKFSSTAGKNKKDGVSEVLLSEGDVNEILPILTKCLEQKSSFPEGFLKSISGLEKLGHAEIYAKALEKLGTAVGSDKTWQTPFRSWGVLGDSLEYLKEADILIPVAKQHLRIIGNAIADNDTNREISLPCLATLAGFIEVEELKTCALGALFNLCNGYDVGTLEAARLRLDATLAKCLAETRSSETDLKYITTIIFWTANALPANELCNDISHMVFKKILDAAYTSHGNPVDSLNFAMPMTVYLGNMDFLPKITALEQDKLFRFYLDYEIQLRDEDLKTVYLNLTATLKGSQQSGEPSPLDERNYVMESNDDSNKDEEHDESDGDEEPPEHDIYMKRLVDCVLAISAEDAFVHGHDLQSNVVKAFTYKITSLSTNPSTICACMMLANLGTSDTSGKLFMEMVRQYKVHVPLISILRTEEPALLYYALLFMSRLANPKENHVSLTNAGIIDACFHLLANSYGAVRGQAAHILSKLAISSFKYAMMMMNQRIPDGGTPTDIDEQTISSHSQSLHYLVTQALVPPTPLPSSKMKIASVELVTAIAAMIVTLYKEKYPNLDWGSVYNTPLLAKPLMSLARQRIFPEARQRVLSALAIMATTPEGVRCLARELDEGLIDSLQDFSRDDAKDKSDDVNFQFKISQHNVLVLLRGLLEHGHALIPSRLEEKVDALERQFSTFSLQMLPVEGFSA